METRYEVRQLVRAWWQSKDVRHTIFLRIFRAIYGLGKRRTDYYYYSTIKTAQSPLKSCLRLKSCKPLPSLQVGGYMTSVRQFSE